MNSIKIISLILSFLFLQSCFILKDNQGVGSGNTVLTIGSYTIYSPNINVNYTFNDINNNIEQINKAKEEANSNLKSINETEKKIKENPAIIQKQKIEQIEKLNEKRQNINKKLPELDKTLAAWESIGFSNDDYRTKKDETDNLFEKMALTDFNNFLGLKKGDFGGAVIKIYGNANKVGASALKYGSSISWILSFSLNEKTGKIISIDIKGQEGHNFVKNKTIDKKYKLVGLQRYKIQEYLGEPTYVNLNELHYNSEDLKLTFYFSEKNSCNEIRLNWENI